MSSIKLNNILEVRYRYSLIEMSIITMITTGARRGQAKGKSHGSNGGLGLGEGEGYGNGSGHDQDKENKI